MLPFVLHRATRETLPRTSRTSLAVWLEENPLARGRVASRAALLVPFTKEALMFGAIHGLIRLDKGSVRPVATWKHAVNRSLAESSEEVKNCAKRATFIGKWFAHAGSVATVLALIGVRP